MNIALAAKRAAEDAKASGNPQALVMLLDSEGETIDFGYAEPSYVIGVYGNNSKTIGTFFPTGAYVPD